MSAHTEAFLGMLINNEDKRLTLRHSINLEKIQDPTLKVIAMALKEETFGFEEFIRKFGRGAMVRFIDLSNEDAKRSLTKKYLGWEKNER